MVKYSYSSSKPFDPDRKAAKMTHLHGTELLDAINRTGLRKTPGTKGLFNAHSAAEMVAAQRLLLDNGYKLSNADMIEGRVYMHAFVPPHSQHPHWITVRYIVVDRPQLVLASFSDGSTQEVELFSTQRTHSTSTSDASKLVTEFSRTFPERHSFWLPVFEGSPFLDQPVSG